jgi:hypothetical protein
MNTCTTIEIINSISAQIYLSNFTEPILHIGMCTLGAEAKRRGGRQNLMLKGKRMTN